MSDEKLVYMANQIARFFASRPPEAAAQGVAEHINQFWDPRMRAQLLARLDAGGEGFAAPVRAAAPAIRRPAA